MLNFGPTFIWVIVNLIILYIVLRKVLFKRVTEMMENRTNSIKNDLDSAQKAKADAALLKQEYEDKLKSARIEADNILNASRERAEAEYSLIIEKARTESEDILAKARKQIENERGQMMKEVKNQVASLALAAASKVLEANMDTESNSILVQKFIDEEGAA